MSHKPDLAAENRLWQEYFAHKSSELRNKLFLMYEPILKYDVNTASLKLPRQINYDEIYSAACSGLINAIELFDPLRKTRFKTYCHQRINGAIYDWVRNMDKQSRTVRAFERKRAKAEQDLQLLGNPRPSDYEVSEKLGMPMDRFDHLVSWSAVGKEITFGAMNRISQKDGDEAHTQIPDSSDPTERISRESMVDSLLKGMGQQDRAVIILYYCKKMTLREIGWVLNVSESRCSQIHSDVLIRIKKRLTGTGKEFVDLFESSQVHRKNGKQHLRYASFV